MTSVKIHDSARAPHVNSQGNHLSQQVGLRRAAEMARRQRSTALHAPVVDVLHGIAHVRDEAADSGGEEEHDGHHAEGSTKISFMASSGG